MIEYDRNIYMTTKEQKETMKAEIIRFIGPIHRHEDLMKKLKLKPATFYRYLKEIKDEHELIPEGHLALEALETYNRHKARVNISWDEMMDTRQDWIESMDKRGTDEHNDAVEDRLRSIYHQKEDKLSRAMYDQARFLKTIGHYIPAHPDVKANIEVNQGITVVFSKGMQDKTTKKTERQVN